ncbi:MAG: multidrug effflux MFS transporter [Candidatus Puniceispirillales bacterium WSBS_2018_MAG_OTU23]
MSKKTPLSLPEFIIILTMMISIVALSIDIMLPALALIGDDLGAKDVNDTQLIISVMFGGFALGQLFVGGLADGLGRKPVIYGGYLIFFIGCLVSIFAETMTAMLIGRFLQGIGAAAPRVVSTSLVRDLYSGREMARIMSFILAAFILIPVIAPLVGQGLIMVFPWQSTFILTLVLGVVVAVWFGVRQPETLPPSKRRGLSVLSLINGLLIVIKNRVVMGYTLALGFISGAFISYLGASRQIFQDVFNTGDLFALYFSIAAVAIGLASLLNARLVMRIDMRVIVRNSFLCITAVSIIFIGVFSLYDGIPPIGLFMTWLMIVFFGMGLLFANISSIAMQPLGNMAGMGAAVIGAVSTLLSLPFAFMIGRLFDGTVMPLTVSYAVLGGVSLAVIYWTELRLMRNI